jgi:hypothetical protein
MMHPVGCTLGADVNCAHRQGLLRGQMRMVQRMQAVVLKLRGERVRAPQAFKLLQIADLREGLEKFHLVE